MSVSCGRALPRYHKITVRTLFGRIMLETETFEGYNLDLLREQAVDYQIEQVQTHGDSVSFQVSMTSSFDAAPFASEAIESETAGHIGELGE